VLHDFSRIALSEFAEIVTSVEFIHRRSAMPEKMRMRLKDETFVDVWVNPSATRYAFHWERRARRGTIYRHDNAPDFPDIATFPKHFHNGSEDAVEESYFDDDLATALRQFLAFVRAMMA
jgi:hypothetical protein